MRRIFKWCLFPAEGNVPAESQGSSCSQKFEVMNRVLKTRPFPVWAEGLLLQVPFVQFTSKMNILKAKKPTGGWEKKKVYLFIYE